MSEHNKNTTRITTSVGGRIRTLRQRRGWTQQEFSQTCFGANAQGRVSHYENNRREPSVDDIRVMARCLGVSEQELISGHTRGASIEGIKDIPLLTPEFFKKRQGKERMAKRVRERLPVPSGIVISDKAFGVRLSSRNIVASEFSNGDIVICDPAVRLLARHFVWASLDGRDSPVVCRYGDIDPASRRCAVIHGVVVAKMKTFV